MSRTRALGFCATAVALAVMLVGVVNTVPGQSSPSTSPAAATSTATTAGATVASGSAASAPKPSGRRAVVTLLTGEEHASPATAPASHGYRPLFPDELSRDKADAAAKAPGGNGHGRPTTTTSPSTTTTTTAPTTTTTASTTTTTASTTTTTTTTTTASTTTTTSSTTTTAPPSGGPTVGPSWSGEYQGNIAPPDPTGAAGPNAYIELINLRYGIYDRAGVLKPDAKKANGHSEDTLTSWTGEASNHSLSDPQVLWDPGTQRFYYLVMDVSTNHFAYGFSKTGDPTTRDDFCHYDVDLGYGGTLPDYPKLGDSADFVLWGVNAFSGGVSYSGSDVDWIAKPAGGAGAITSCPTGGFLGGVFNAVNNADGTKTSTPVPAVQADSSPTGWVVGSHDGSGSSLTVFSVTRDASTGAAVLGPPGAVAVASYSVPANAPQPGGGRVVDTLDGRLEHAVVAFDPAAGTTAVWTAHAVFGGAGSEERWYEIDPAGASLIQSGRATSSSFYVWNGAVSPDRADDGVTAAFGSNMVMGFNTSSSNAYPAIQMVSKRRGSAQSSFVMLHQSPGKNDDFTCYSPYGPPCRWGDYSGAMPDPAADQSGTAGRVWLSGEWNVASTDASGTDWRTWNWAAMP